MLVQRLDLLDILKEAFEEGAAMLLDRVPAEHEVGGCHGMAVVEFGFGRRLKTTQLLSSGYSAVSAIRP